MNLRRSLLATLSVLAVTALAFAFQTLQPVNDNQNILRNRLAGKWVLNAAMTRSLQPDGGARFSETLDFTNDPTVMERLIPAKERLTLNGMHLFQSGILTMDGKPFPYVVTNEHGNATLIYFATANNIIGDATAVNIGIAVGRPQTQDLLYFGGKADGSQGSGVYTRAAATALPAGAPTPK